MNVSRKRGLWIKLGIGIVGILCLVGVLFVRLLGAVFPFNIAPRKPGVKEPLGKGDAIAFSYMRLDMLRPFELYILEDAHGIRSISQGLRRSDIGSVWSPDGALLAYKSVSGRATRTYLVDADGANRREITRDDRRKELLRWSPDGSRLAYLAYLDSGGSVSGSPYLCVTDVHTGETDQTAAGEIYELAWTPDGQSLLAIVGADEQISIGLYDANGNDQQRTSAADYLREAAYIAVAPDASKVAYISPITDDDVESATVPLNVSALDGSVHQSVDVSWPEGTIGWSPDSTKLAFVALGDGYEYALYVVNTDGMQVQELMSINVGDESGEILPAAPAWSPDGTRLAISSYHSFDGAAIFVMNADGTERRQVTTTAGSGGMFYDLAWRPGE